MDVEEEQYADFLAHDFWEIDLEGDREHAL